MPLLECEQGHSSAALKEASVTSLLQVLSWLTASSIQWFSSVCLREEYFSQASTLLCPLLLPLSHKELLQMANQALSDLSHKYLHMLPGRFLGRLHLDAVTSPIISTYYCNRNKSPSIAPVWHHRAAASRWSPEAPSDPSDSVTRGEAEGKAAARILMVWDVLSTDDSDGHKRRSWMGMKDIMWTFRHICSMMYWHCLYWCERKKKFFEVNG